MSDVRDWSGSNSFVLSWLSELMNESSCFESEYELFHKQKSSCCCFTIALLLDLVVINWITDNANALKKIVFVPWLLISFHPKWWHQYQGL